jgi:L-ascorbate metabolism protein UlaG (beta-lactamase superfamily)
VVEIEGKRIYHAGDLNWWHWENETPSEQQNMERHYKAYLEKIRDTSFDVAMIPYDVKLGAHTAKGIGYFLSVARAAHVFPMHFWDAYDRLKLLEGDTQTASAKQTQFHLPTKEGEVFVL